MVAANTSRRAGSAHAATPEPVLQSYCEQVTPVDPVALFHLAQDGMGAAAYWERPQDDLVLVGMGATQQITLQGPATGAWIFGEARREWQRLVAGAQAFGDTAGGPLLLGGFAFDLLRPATAVWDGYPSGLLTLPRLLYRQSGGQASVTYSVVLPPGASAERAIRTLRDAWRAALSGVREQELIVREREAHPGDQTRGASVTSMRGVMAATSASFAHRSVQASADASQRDPWCDRVARAARAIRDGQLEKVVLARQLRLPAEDVVDAATALARLRVGMSSGLIFAVASAGRCFLGATPERLIRLQEGQVATAALAGSRRRGATAGEDAALEQELLRSSKDRWEHTIVVRELTDGLNAAGVELPPTPRPVVMKLSSVQHLFTPLSGRVDGDSTVLDLLERLHPSPAVGGYPRGEALDWIRQHEGVDRGWYAGPVGWMDTAGNGDFAVGIRSALMDRYGALLFAGCGIMGDSSPDEEFAESELKLRPMLLALRR
ncbi:MAG TPA: isochorismate synthase [Chloroflexota bacterium]|nr:isochorismate synthase [Chloroflexota bacterium]